MNLSQKASEHLKNLRVYNGLTTEQFADLIKQKREAVSRWENGRSSLTMKTFDRICERLKLVPTDFLCGEAEIKLDMDAIKSSSNS
jgi:transcriptional regulator with XRE-family HTH domain